MDVVDLEVYRLAEDFVVKIYQVSRKFPREEVYGITSQIRRASLSIALNIAEAFGRYHYKDRLLFLYHARGSIVEVKSLLRLCNSLDILSDNQMEDINDDLIKIHVKLNNYITSTKRRIAK